MSNYGRVPYSDGDGGGLTIVLPRQSRQALQNTGLGNNMPQLTPITEGTFSHYNIPSHPSVHCVVYYGVCFDGGNTSM